jgi:phosphatidate cytidylyltransferase
MTAAVPGAGAQGRGELGLRIASSLVLAPLALAATWAGYPWFEVMVAVLAVAMTVEWARMVWGPDFSRPAITGAAICVFAIALAAQGHAAAIAGLIALALLGTVARGLVKKDWNQTWVIGGVAYVAVPCISVVWLREAVPAGFDILVWLMLTVWGTDIAAYAVGRSLGGPKLAPRVSPGKTWSGLIGGMIGAGAISAGLMAWHGLGAWMVAAAFGLGLIAALVAQSGDLLESALKRRFGAKDSGVLIPGHGGVLDRLDGILAAAPVTAAAVWLAGGDLSAWR